MANDKAGNPTANKAQIAEDVKVARQQQHTGNHERDERVTEQPYGADVFGGTRAGAENVEGKGSPKPGGR